MDRLSTAELNAMEMDSFVAKLQALYEHSDWIARRLAAQRPFRDRAALATAMRMAVETGTDEEKLALIRAHPDLAGMLVRGGDPAAAPARENPVLGLDPLTQEELEHVTGLNGRYRDRFGFPFVICVRLVDKRGIISAFETRLENSLAAEISEALRQIHCIARLRLGDLVAD